jgi:pimeloyl-ACP methyl ester carboxylesterase
VKTRRLRHARIELALHELRAGAGRTLLLLHGLGERSPSAVPPFAGHWPGPVFALDFTGHGESSASVGGGYTAEVLMGDADTALRELGSATLLGRGLGAYVALLLAGARPAQVRGAVLCDGLGLAGGGAEAATPSIVYPNPHAAAPPDPFALVELARDVRPPDYATAFVRQANELSGLERPITVCCAEKPDWLEAALREPGVQTASVEDALAYYAKRG